MRLHGCLWMGVAVIWMVTATASASDALVPASFGGGAAADLACWSPTSQWVGNPNSCHRRDRVVFHFDLARYLLAGQVALAELSLSLAPFGLFDDHEFEVQIFQSSHAPVTAMDLISGDVAPVHRVTIRPGEGVKQLTLPVTEFINQALYSGAGVVTFRVTDLTLERLGNRKNREEGATVEAASIQLEIER